MEIYDRRKRIHTINVSSFENSQTNEKLTLTGFGCNRCDWKYKASTVQFYHKALKAHGVHNCTSHPKDTTASITWLYISK